MSALHELFAEWVGTPALALLMADQEMVPYLVGGVPFAIGALSGSEIHFAVAPLVRRRLITRARLAEYLGPLLAEHGFLTTRIWPGSDRSFVERLGFELTGEADGVAYYMLTDVPFARAGKE